MSVVQVDALSPGAVSSLVLQGDGAFWIGGTRCDFGFSSEFFDSLCACVCACRGFRHIVSAIPAQQNLASASIVSYKDRMVR